MKILTLKNVVFAGIVIAIVVLWLLWPSIVLGRHEVKAAAEGQTSALPAAGQFGDMYGAFTAGLTALTFAGVILGIYLQRSQLALAKADSAADSQAREDGALESHFFQLLGLTLQHITRLRHGTESSGPEALRLRANDILTSSAQTAKVTPEGEWALHLQSVVTQNIASSSTGHVMIPFFESLYLLIEHVLSHAKPTSTLPSRLLRILVATLGHNVVGLAVLHAVFMGTQRERNLIVCLQEQAPFETSEAKDVVAWALKRAGKK